jgi:SAM-dependent methyltransferase
MSRLTDIYSNYSYPGGWGDKGTAHNYLPTYEKYMTQTDNITLLEIGVMRGHSIKMWNEYFTNSTIIGIDITLENLEYQLDNVHRCDGTSNEAINALFPNWTFDYVIDDGSHTLKDQLASIDVFLHRMKPGGVYFIEDIAGDEPLAAITQRLTGHNYTVIDGRGPNRPMDEIMVVVQNL